MSIPDKELKQTVLNRLREDRRLDASDIKVEVEQGRVFLKGSAETVQASAFAQEDAAKVTGVKRIVNRIQVNLPEKIAPPTDEAIRARIHATLSLDSETKPVDLVLVVANGVVFLDGFVETLRDKHHIGAIVAREHGVLAVRNNLSVVHGHFRRDKDIADDILGTRQWAEVVKNDGVRVRIEVGVVTFKGTVSSETARRALMDSTAAIPGVVEIRDRLRMAGCENCDSLS
jgi:osmotically-inducible protein OsmY